MLHIYSPNFGDFWLGPWGVGRGLLAFPLGCVLARQLSHSAGALRPYAGRIETVSLAWMAAAGALSRPELILAGAAGLIVGLSLDAGPFARLLRCRPCRWLGRISFSIYLIHLPVLLLMGKIITPTHILLPPTAVALIRAGVVFALVLPLSALSYRWIEIPGQSLPRRFGTLRLARLSGTVSSASFYF